MNTHTDFLLEIELLTSPGGPGKPLGPFVPGTLFS